MNTFTVFALCVGFVGFVAGRDLTLFQVLGNGNNIGSAFVQTELTTPVYTPGFTSEVFDTTLETNFTTGIGRFLGFRNTSAETTGPGTQASGGSSNISSIIGTSGSFLTQAGSLVNGGSINAGAPGTIGATFTNTTNEVISLTGTTTPIGSFAYNSINTGSVRQGLGASQSQGANQAATAAADQTQPLILQSNSVGAAQSQAVGVDTLTFVDGNTFSTTGSQETVTGCEQSTGGAVYGSADGNATSAAACSSRGQFVG